jgi:EAL domain-containing protein (putative c-di-GMP-specific phosphodiesterase class I)
VCEKLLALLREPIWLVDREVHVSASMGVAIYPTDAKNADTLLQLADVAMYRSKQEGRRCYTFFAAEMNRSLRSEAEFEIRLRRAMADGYLALWYQPQYNLRNGVVIGAEALMRWIEPDGTSVAPNQFIPLAEKLGLIHAIGEWALYEACRQSREWRRQLGKAVPVAVNVSPLQFRRPGLCSTIERSLSETGLAPEDLIIEIAESVVMEDLVVTQQTLSALVNLGVRLAIDDFGNGLSSLAHLKRFPVHHLKIDRNYVQDLGRSSEDEAMVRTIIQLGHSLHLSVAAKGVETEAQAALLRAHGCDFAQGYLYSVPLPRARFMALLGLAQEAVALEHG